MPSEGILCRHSRTQVYQTRLLSHTGWLSAQQRVQHWDSDSDLTLESTVSMHLSLGAKQECQENDPINREMSKSTILVWSLQFSFNFGLFSTWDVCTDMMGVAAAEVRGGEWKRHREQPQGNWIQLAPRPHPTDWDAPAGEKTWDPLSTQRLRQAMCSLEWAMDWEMCRISTSG